MASGAAANLVTATKPPRVPAGPLLLGIALGGFFDGILLHQVLQWHHLLSLLPGDEWRDLRRQVLADGLFHVLMYGVALVGLYLSWRGSRDLAKLGKRYVAAIALLGFAVWQFIDVVGFHWIAGIHRIRVGVPDPMLYDLGWLAAFGVTSLAAALWMLGGSTGGRGGRSAAAALGVVTLVAGPVAALPPPGVDTAVAMFLPGTTPGQAFAAAGAAGTPIVWADPSGLLLAVSLDTPRAAAVLRANGALIVTRSAGLAGCLAATRWRA